MTKNRLSPQDALARLQAGNARFVAGVRSVDTLSSARLLAKLAVKGQRPFAAALACADSRVPVEIVFDCGLGDLFVNRVAGNIVTMHMIASLEYAATQTGASVIFVLGHTGCGAVKAAVGAEEADARRLTPSLGLLVGDLKGAVEAARRVQPGVELCAAVERENVRLGCQQLLRRSEVLARLEKAGKIAVVGAICDMTTGAVEFGLERKAPVEIPRAAARSRAPIGRASAQASL